ncbi:MAG: hypothetical protein VX044_08920 [Planctomycetota bacterium]|nr:hypothetical protein [Planctomycetota bacterium]
MTLKKHLTFIVAAVCCVSIASAQTSDRDHLRSNVLGQMQWKQLGPVQSGGRIVDIAVNPKRPQEYWLASASGGVWHTTNGGVSFEPQLQNAYTISVGDLAVAPSDPRVVYVGTGEGNNQRSSFWGDGVYRSDDSGETWKWVGLAGTDHIGRVVVHPDNPDTVYVAALGALYSSNEQRGLYKTTDGGASWDKVLYISEDVGVVDVVMHPQKPDVLFAASYERRRRAWNFEEGGAGSRIYRSIDGGTTWETLGKGLPDGKLGRIGLDCYLRDGDTIYASIENLNPRARARKGSDGDDDGDARTDAAPSAEQLADPVAKQEWLDGPEEAQDPRRRARQRLVGGEVYRSDDGGDTWAKTHKDDLSVGGSPGYYYGQIRVDPNDADNLWVLSVAVYQSKDGGKKWTPAGRRRGGRSFGSTLHSDHHALWIDPQDSQHCLLGNDGGVAVTWDQGANWDHLTHLPILQFYAIGVDRGTPYKVYGGLQDNGTWGFPIHGPTSAGLEPQDAFKVSGGDGFYSVPDPHDPDTVYSESQFGGMLRSNLRTGARKSIKPRARKGEQPLRFNWMTPIVVSPHAPDTIYCGSQHLHRSRNRGDDWATISGDLSTNDVEKKKGDVPHCTITTISESPLREGHVWVGTDDGKVWVTKDGGARFTDLTDRFPAPVKGLWVSRVEASPHDADTAFVSFTGYREDIRDAYVFRTDDGGESWLSIAHELPREPVNVIRQHPRNASVLFVGTEMDVHVSIDDGAHWAPLGYGLPRAAAHDLLIHPTHPHLLVGTHGRGIWGLDASAFEALKTSALRTPLLALPPSDGVLLRGGFDRGYFGARRWRVPNPFTTATFRYVLAQDSPESPKVEVLDAAGEVVFSADGGNDAGYHEVEWGGGSGGMRRRSNRGARPGTFAVRITHQGQSTTQAFTVHDLRGPTSVLGDYPGAEVRDEEDGAGDGGR